MNSGKKTGKPPLKKKTYQKPTLTTFGRQHNLTTAGGAAFKQVASSGRKPQPDG